MDKNGLFLDFYFLNKNKQTKKAREQDTEVRCYNGKIMAFA